MTDCMDWWSEASGITLYLVRRGTESGRTAQSDGPAGGVQNLAEQFSLTGPADRVQNLAVEALSCQEACRKEDVTG